MNKQIKIFLPASLLILLSTPLGRVSVNIFYASKNLTGEYDIILKSFIHSYMLLGVLIFSIGLIELLKKQDR
ncbi:MAG: hypothetical protein ACTIH2_00360 [Anaerococcus sp.]